MPVETISADLKANLRRLRLSPMLETMPERLALAKQQKLPYQEFLEILLSDEISRRDRISTDLRAKAARLDPTMRVEAWDDTSAVNFDQQLWGELTTLRFLEDNQNVIIMGPVGVGKTFMANALGYVACRRRCSVMFYRTDRMLKRLKAARLDQSYESEIKKLIRVDLLILDDFGLHSFDPTETQDIYEIVVERHLRS
ncbi:MAG: ATP-binding protein, partial [Actinomycetota bacterium]